MIWTTWKPPHVEKQSVLQLDEQCIRLDIRGKMKRLRQHQQVRDVMVSVSRSGLRPFGVLTNLGRKGHRKSSLEPGTPISTTNGEPASRSESKRRSD